MSSWLGTVKRGHGRANADGGWRMRTEDGGWRTADGGRRMGLFKKKKNRMFIVLNLLINCHLLRNASFGYFSFFCWFELIYILLSVKQRKRYRMFLLVFQPNQTEFVVELRTLVRHTIRQKNTFTFMNIYRII